MSIRYIHSKAGEQLYMEVACSAEIVDYHCHLDPKAIYEDKEFSDIGVMWLEKDHYKWRLMRFAGIDEEYITGNRSWYEKFEAYCRTLENSPGNPLNHWSSLELSMFFDIDIPISGNNAKVIWDMANNVIREKHLSPRKLIMQSRVIYIATTDDISDDLKYHKLISEDKTFPVMVRPTFRTDSMMLLNRNGYADYIKKLSDMTKTEIKDISSLCEALIKRLDYFTSMGCSISDVGIQYSPDPVYTNEEADKAFKKALEGIYVDSPLFLKFLGYMFVFLSGEYKKRDMTQQIHTGVIRNVNTGLFNKIGCDAGCDMSGDPMDGAAFAKLLDVMDKEGKLARSIVYILNPASLYQVMTACSSFRDVLFGAAWWHLDHYDGIEENIRTVASLSSLGSYMGMLTDSRSFLSYARHDYFRKILCSVIGCWVDDGEYPIEMAKKVIYNICVGNAKNRFVRD